MSVYNPKDYFLCDVPKVLLCGGAVGYVALACTVITIQPFVSLGCADTEAHHLSFGNRLYVDDPCRSVPQWQLLGMTIDQCEHGRRLVWATVFGSVFGWERRTADRPAGIRTMALVSLGACLFTLCSTFAFLSGPMAWDSSRVAAWIPSGVGFLGSAMIFKHTASEEKAWHEVHGLATAASVWLSAAVGIACAGGLYFVASFTTAIVLGLLRFGPRSRHMEDDWDAEGADPIDELATISVGHSTQRLSNYSAVTTDPAVQSIIPAARNSRREAMDKGVSKRSLRPSLMM